MNHKKFSEQHYRNSLGVDYMDKVVHFEIPVEDISRAEKFYNSIFGWKIQNIPEMGYTLVFTAKTNDKGMNTEVGAINGGMMKRKTQLRIQ